MAVFLYHLLPAIDLLCIAEEGNFVISAFILVQTKYHDVLPDILHDNAFNELLLLVLERVGCERLIILVVPLIDIVEH